MFRWSLVRLRPWFGLVEHGITVRADHRPIARFEAGSCDGLSPVVGPFTQ